MFFGRFVAVLRAFAAVLAGANKFAPLRFFLFNAAGGIVWACIFGLGGYFLGSEFHRITGPVGFVRAGAGACGVFCLRPLPAQNEARLIEREARGGACPDRWN